MRALGLTMLIAALPATAQTTTRCIRNGIETNCTTTPDQPSWTTLLPKPREASPPPVYYPRAPSQREQVASLIARGDCPSAVRLAHYYGKAKLIASTEAACR